MRPGLVFLLLFLFGGEVAGREPEPQSTPLAAEVYEPARPFRWMLPKGRAAAAKQKALKGTIARRQVVFVDVDGDGRFDEPGVDGWLIEPGYYLVPFRAPIVIESSLVRVRIDPETKTATWRAEAIDAPRDHRYALADVNELRMRNGLAPVGYSAELSKACLAHCLYCDKHGITHYEKKGRAGYTPEGAKSGRNGNVATGDDLDRVGRDSYATFFHRRTLMEPDTTAFGFGVSKKHVLLDGLSLREPVPWQRPIVVPALGTEAVPTAFNHTEVPPPVPPRPPAGFPITLRWPPGTSIKSVKATLRTSRKKKVAAYVSWMEKPAHASIPHNQYSICIIAKRVLKAGTEYTVEVTAEIDGEPYETSFTFRTEGVRRR